MDSKKLFFGGIIGGIANFFLGWLVWGILLMDYLMKHSTHIPGVFRTEQEMVWWAMIVANLASGFLIAYILMKAKVGTFSGGMVTGAVIGLLTAVAFDCMMYAQMHVIGRAVMAVDAAASTIVTAIIGGIVAWYLGRGEKAV